MALVFFSTSVDYIFLSSNCYAGTESMQAGSEIREEISESQIADSVFVAGGSPGKMSDTNSEKEKKLVKEASFYLSKKAYAKAEKLLKEVWENNPQNGDACLLWAVLYSETGQKERAARLFKRATETLLEKDEAYAELGRFYQRRGDFTRAKEYYAQALAVNPANKKAVAELKFVQDVLSINEYKKALLVNPKDEKAAVRLGSAYLEQGKLIDAEGILSYVIRLNPRNDEALAQAGWLYLKQKKQVGAKDFFVKALKINPSNETALKGIKALSESK